LYERAATSHARPDDALWHLGKGQTFFSGPLFYNANHEHGAPVYLAGLYDEFLVRVAQGPWRRTRTAMIPAGVRHELRLDGQPLAVFYIEPDQAGPEVLVPLVRDAAEEGGALLGRRGEVAAFRALYEDPAAAAWAGEALGDLARFSGRRAGVSGRRPLDPRVAQVLGWLRDEADPAPAPLARLAAAVGLSASRFQHLFTAAVGVPFRRYRAWLRMRRAIAEIVRGRSFTRAAHLAGFADQAHFAHDFKRTFGAPAGVSLGVVRGAAPPMSRPGSPARAPLSPLRLP